MPSDELESFIGSSFRSVWALELLLLLRRQDQECPTATLVTLLQASPSVVDKALETLTAAGLAGLDGGLARYMPVGRGVAALVEQTETLYRTRPDHVRRLIIASSHRGLTAFSNAFRLKD